MDFAKFGNKISTIRKQQKISQDMLAKDIGISRATLSSLENGKEIDVGFKKVLQILNYLGYEISMKESTPFPTFEELRDGQ